MDYQIAAFFVFMVFTVLVAKMVMDVQIAKAEGSYLSPDNPADYGVEVDEDSLFQTETFLSKQNSYINDDGNFDEQGDNINF